MKGIPNSVSRTVLRAGVGFEAEFPSHHQRAMHFFIALIALFDVWLDFCCCCGYLTENKRRHLLKRIEEPMKQFESNQNVLAGKDAKRIIKVGGTNTYLDIQ